MAIVTIAIGSLQARMEQIAESLPMLKRMVLLRVLRLILQQTTQFILITRI